jgi:hypothetical protein
MSGTGKNGYADGEGAAAHFNHPSAVVVDKEGTIVVADKDNHRLCRMTGCQVTTLAGGSEAGAGRGELQQAHSPGARVMGRRRAGTAGAGKGAATAREEERERARARKRRAGRTTRGRYAQRWSWRC